MAGSETHQTARPMSCTVGTAGSDAGPQAGQPVAGGTLKVPPRPPTLPLRDPPTLVPPPSPPPALPPPEPSPPPPGLPGGPPAPGGHPCGQVWPSVGQGGPSRWSGQIDALYVPHTYAQSVGAGVSWRASSRARI